MILTSNHAHGGDSDTMYFMCQKFQGFPIFHPPKASHWLVYKKLKSQAIFLHF